MSVLIDAPSLSPRLQWLDRHRLLTRHYDGPHGCGGPEGPGWVCGNHSRTQNAGGADVETAEMVYAARYGIRHWLVEDWDRAMGSQPCQNPGCGNTIVDRGEEECPACGHCVAVENLDE